MRNVTDTFCFPRKQVNSGKGVKNIKLFVGMPDKTIQD